MYRIFTNLEFSLVEFLSTDLVRPEITCQTSIATVELEFTGSEWSAQLNSSELIVPDSAVDHCSDTVSVTPSPTSVKCEKRQETHEIVVRAGDSRW